MAIAYSVRVSGGGTDSFHGFEYFGLITLASREFRVLLAVLCAFLASTVSHGVAAPPLLPTLAVYYREVPLLVFRLVWCWSGVFCRVCADCADDSSAGSCASLAQGCRGGGFFLNSAVFTLVLGTSVLAYGILALPLFWGLGAPFCHLSLWPHPLLMFSRLGFLPWAFVRTWVGRLRSCLGSCLLLGELSFPCPGFHLAVPAVWLSRLLMFSGIFPWVLSSRVQCLLIA